MLRHMHKGQRVQLHPATSEWMQGDRYGEVIGYGRARAPGRHNETTPTCPIRVRLDSGRVRRFHPDNVSAV